MVTSPKLLSWTKNESLLTSLQPFAKWHYIERDLAMFNMNIDDDYVPCLQGITRASYCNVYLEWIQYCAGKRQEVDGGAGQAGIGNHHLCLCFVLGCVWISPSAQGG
jgi:predicted component of type VI protein secretion system